MREFTRFLCTFVYALDGDCYFAGSYACFKNQRWKSYPYASNISMTPKELNCQGINYNLQ
jgi:hypothetical protein